jgi:hypothetical protein
MLLLARPGSTTVNWNLQSELITLRCTCERDETGAKDAPASQIQHKDDAMSILVPNTKACNKDSFLHTQQINTQQFTMRLHIHKRSI